MDDWNDAFVDPLPIKHISNEVNIKFKSSRPVTFENDNHYFETDERNYRRKCKCYNEYCYLNETRITKNPNPAYNLYNYPINKPQERNLDTLTEFLPPEIYKNDIFVFRRIKNIKNLVYIELLLKSEYAENLFKEQDEVNYIKDATKYCENYILNLNNDVNSMQKLIKQHFNDEFDTKHRDKYTRTLRGSKPYSENYGGRPIMVYYYDRFSKQHKYARATLTHAKRQKYYQENIMKTIAQSTINCQLVDDYTTFINNIPISHYLLINGDDKLLLKPSKSRYIWVNNFENLPNNEYFIAKTLCRKFTDIFRRPSYDLEIVENFDEKAQFKHQNMSLVNIYDFFKQYDLSNARVKEYKIESSSQICKDVEYQNGERKSSSIQNPLIVPSPIYNGTCYLRNKHYDSKDAEIQRNRILNGFEKNRNFPCKNLKSCNEVNASEFRKFDDCIIYDNEIMQNESNKQIQNKFVGFKSKSVQHAFHKLHLRFDYVKSGSVKGWVVKSLLNQDDKASIILKEDVVLEEVHRKYLVFKQCEVGNFLKIVIKLDDIFK